MRRALAMLLTLTCAVRVPAQSTNAPALPAVQTRTYRNGFGEEHVYVVQEPSKPKKPAQVLIYQHGAGGGEEQGMDVQWASRTFGRLRALLDGWGWVYVCPRDDDFPGLVAALKEKYKPETVVLAGASAGGRAVLTEAVRAPQTYAGLILLCPAIRNGAGGSRLTMPVWLVSATGDRGIHESTRALVRELELAQKRYRFVEIAGGGHDTPVREVDWEQALRFCIAAEKPEERR